MGVYLYIPKIDGGAKEAGHDKWIQVDSMQFGANRQLNSIVGRGTDREGGAPMVSEVTFTKSQDASSIELFAWAVAAFEAKECKIDITSTGRADPYTSFKLYEAVISSYSVSTASEGLPMEAFSLNFVKIENKFTPVGTDMKAGTPITKVYDLSTGKAG